MTTGTLDLVAEADRLAAETAAEVEILEQAVRNGDTSVKPEQLGRVRDIARYAELSREAARSRAERERIASARADRDALLAELGKAGAKSVAGSREALDKAIAAAKAALAEAADLAAAHSKLVSGYVRQLNALKSRLPAGDVRQVSMTHSQIGPVRWSGGNGLLGTSLRIGDLDAGQASPKHIVADVTRSVRP
jgi:hypothetical protein